MIITSIGGAIRAGGIALLLATSAGATAVAADLPLARKAPPAPPSDPSPFWVEIDALAWTVKGDHLPALVTTSPPGTPFATAGTLGAPGTAVLFGDSTVNDGWRAGGRITAGYWLDRAHTRAIEASFFDLQDASTNFAASSNGTTILARPFVDATTNLQSAQLIAFPGVASGSVAAGETSRLLGADLHFRQDIGTYAGEHISALIGYRYLRASDRLGISDSQTALSGAFGVPAGTLLSASDAFDATSDFHGLDLGLTGAWVRGPWTLDWRATVALGANLNSTHISGSSTTTLPGGVATTSPGGLLALSSNIGSYSQTRFAAVPELSLKAGYQLTSQWRLIAGYDVLYWTGVQRAGDLIDTTVNPNLLGGGPGGPPARPQALLNTTSLLAQGFSLGARYGF